MSAGDTAQLPPEWQVADPPRRRRRAWPWIVALVIVVALAVAAFFIAEWVARGIVERTVKTEISKQLSLPADHEVDVDVPGLLIPQLLGGSLDQVTVSSQDVPVGAFEGDVTVTATEVPIQQGVDMGGATATVTLDEEQLRSLMSTVDGFPADTLGLAAPNVTMSTELQFFGLEFPIGVALTPSVSDGDLVLTPASFELAGAEIDAGALSDRFGSIADIVVRDWSVCLAQYIPAGVTLTGVEVTGGTLVAEADVDGGIVTDPALQANGSCG
ncbi:DUF2993 domain-containing protein [Microbacterium sp. SSM24]|uniref:LmeA family phospholipid-binding protein n=1 Tax=Microbacterium sp. SSM24 TaxID=2991714 RepID=UPI002226BAAD|nr:DUF2993 domain-containing protein [Microbacterium sp. SSM24]MCW3493905.1 DUF2993 domain-containing protein [Microbacterium sp. SSM24]